MRNATKTTTKIPSLIVAACIATSIVFGGAAAHAAEADPLTAAMKAVKPILDLRLRYEYVDQEPLTKEADALTLRGRFGVETGKAWDTALLIEGEGIVANEDYNDSINGKAALPVVADPRGWELNRLQLTNTSIPKTTIVLGRQRINLDDQRFVGNVGWRQNEQTYDALRVTNTAIGSVTLDAIYLDQVNRVFGRRSPQGRRHGDTYLLNAGAQTPFGRLSGFAYLLDFEDAIAVADSSQTYGARFTGSRPVGDARVTYTASWATQSDYTTSPLNYSLNYWLGELGAAYQEFSAGVGYEVLGGNGVRGFSTPLATLHRFQGWADKFLATPPNGIKDFYATLAYTRKTLGILENVGATAVYHTYDSDRLSLDYGDEINLQLQGRWSRYTFTLKYADYNAASFATDTKKVWFQVEFSL